MSPTVAALAISTVSAMGSDIKMSLVHAVEQIESGGNPNARGDGGKARGSMQFHASAWKDITRIRKAAGLPTWPYAKACDQQIARTYARTWLSSIRARLIEDTGREPRVCEIYLAWNMGYEAFRRIGFQPWRAEEARYDAAMRCEQLERQYR